MKHWQIFKWVGLKIKWGGLWSWTDFHTVSLLTDYLLNGDKTTCLIIQGYWTHCKGIWIRDLSCICDHKLASTEGIGSFQMMKQILALETHSQWLQVIAPLNTVVLNNGICLCV
jgi:hypothetical protein